MTAHETNDRMMRALRGEENDRRPLWIMRQAGRYLPEYRALRRENTFEELCASPELSAEVTMMPMERFPLDAAIVFADLMSPVGALGSDGPFAPGPVIETPLRTAASVRALRVPDAGAPRQAAPRRPRRPDRLRRRAALDRRLPRPGQGRQGLRLAARAAARGPGRLW